MRNVITLVIAALVLLVPGGCKTDTPMEATPAEIARIEMMQKVPVFYDDFEFWDARTLREDSGLGEMYQVWYDRKVKFLEERYGINGSSIEYLAEGEGLLDIIRAPYNVEALREKIAADFHRDTSYPDMEVWKSQPPPGPPGSGPPSATGGWVLAEGFLVRGANYSNVEDYLRVARAEELSMYDKNAAAVLERLPVGLLTRISRSSSPKGSILSGMSVKKEDKSTLRWTNVYKFASVEKAGSAETNEYFKKIEDDFKKAQDELAKRGEPSPFRSFTIKQDGAFVEWSMMIEGKYMIALLFFG